MGGIGWVPVGGGEKLNKKLNKLPLDTAATPCWVCTLAPHLIDHHLPMETKIGEPIKKKVGENLGGAPG